jgi:hypothetical protein
LKKTIAVIVWLVTLVAAWFLFTGFGLSETNKTPFLIGMLVVLAAGGYGGYYLWAKQ